MAFGIKQKKPKQNENVVTKKQESAPKRQKATLWVKFINKLKEYRRVLKITKKPTSKEFKMIVKVTSLGIAAIGAIGFIIWFILTLFE